MSDSTTSYRLRRGEIARYFDRTAADAWRQLTSDAPLGRIRESVRAGRQRMGTTLLALLPSDLAGLRVLDAGCGTGVLSVALAQRGAEVIAVDLSSTLVDLARERQRTALPGAAIEFVCGDMLDPGLGEFDHVVAMDSLIHYAGNDMVGALESLVPRVRHSLAFTCVPLTPALAVKRAAGRLFPRSDRAPDVRPRRFTALRRDLAEALGSGWRLSSPQRVSSGFYTSEALWLERQ